MALLSVDIGTGGTRSVLFNETGDIIASSYREYSFVSPRPGWAELEAETIWEAFRKTVRETAKQHGKQIKAVCLSCMSNNIVPVRRDGTAIRNGILSQDNRATDETAVIREVIGEAEYFRIRGGRLRPASGLCKIIWLKKHEPDTFRQTWKFMTFSDFIRMRLGFPAIIDYATAASSLPYDIRKQDYSDMLLKEFGLNRKLFSDTVPSDYVLGEIGTEVRTELGLPQGVRFVTGGYDSHCGILGAGITQATPRIAADIGGTFERVARVKTKPALSQKALKNDINSNCYLFKDTYVISSALATSGSIVRWFRDKFESTANNDINNTYDRMFSPLKFEGGTVMFIPYFAGSAGDSLARGAFLGLTLDTTRQQMFQAVIEGITHEMTLMLSRLEEQGGTPIDIIRACGGPAKSTNWLQLKADISGKTVEAPAVEEASALGAALLAGVATGVYTSYEQAIKAAVKIKATYRPRAEIHQQYQRQHETYKHLVKTLTPVSKEFYNIR
jgi:xylulokinase